jgi:transcriptional regulator with XRE-family HTH domain
MSDAEKRARALRFRALRKALGFTAIQFADLAGVDRTLISKIETRKNQVTTVDIQQKLAPAFGLSVADFGAYMAGDLTIEEAKTRRAIVTLTVARDLLEQVEAHPLRWHAGALLRAAREASAGPCETEARLDALELEIVGASPPDEVRRMVAEATAAVASARR